MGGLTSKTFKPARKHDKKDVDIEEKRSSATGVEHRDKELKLSRETKSAYYYGRKNGVAEGADKPNTAADQRRVVLKGAGGSDQTVFKRVRETPTAIYYEPNDDEDDTDAVPDTKKEGDKDAKNIVLENVPVVEKRIKVIRDGSSDITIRPESITIQKHDMIVDHTVGKKPRSNILNTYSVMVKSKETDAVPSATVTLDDDKGLMAIQEGTERESQLVEDETKDTTLPSGNNENDSAKEDKIKSSDGSIEQKDSQLSNRDNAKTEQDTVNKDNSIKMDQTTDKELDKSVEDQDKSIGIIDIAANNDNTDFAGTTSEEKKSTEPDTKTIENAKHQTNGIDELNTLNHEVAETSECPNTENVTKQKHLNVNDNVNEETLLANSEQNNVTDIENGVTTS